MYVKIVSELRGWELIPIKFHDKRHWTARRHGVTMNNRSYLGIIRMILQRGY